MDLVGRFPYILNTRKDFLPYCSSKWVAARAVASRGVRRWTVDDELKQLCYSSSLIYRNILYISIY